MAPAQGWHAKIENGIELFCPAEIDILCKFYPLHKDNRHNRFVNESGPRWLRHTKACSTIKLDASACISDMNTPDQDNLKHAYNCTMQRFDIDKKHCLEGRGLGKIVHSFSLYLCFDIGSGTATSDWRGIIMPSQGIESSWTAALIHQDRYTRMICMTSLALSDWDRTFTVKTVIKDDRDANPRWPCDFVLAPHKNEMHQLIRAISIIGPSNAVHCPQIE